jgi:hypothetical protein
LYKTGIVHGAKSTNRFVIDLLTIAGDAVSSVIQGSMHRQYWNLNFDHRMLYAGVLPDTAQVPLELAPLHQNLHRYQQLHYHPIQQRMYYP